MRTGKPLSKYCPKGHLMAETRKRYANGESYCSVCKNERSKKAHSENPQLFKRYMRRSNLRRLYGLEEVEFEAILLLQDNKCGVCKREFEDKKKPHVDHNHETGRIRGILCHRCNTAIGLAREDISILLTMIEYLKT